MSEKKYRAWFRTGANTYVDFTADVADVPEDERREVLEEAAYAAFQGVSLCHQCNHEVELGDFEIPEDDDAVEEVA